jgi:hypothetical protein
MSISIGPVLTAAAGSDAFDSYPKYSVVTSPSLLCQEEVCGVGCDEQPVDGDEVDQPLPKRMRMRCACAAARPLLVRAEAAGEDGVDYYFVVVSASSGDDGDVVVVPGYPDADEAVSSSDADELLGSSMVTVLRRAVGATGSAESAACAALVDDDGCGRVRAGMCAKRARALASIAADLGAARRLSSSALSMAQMLMAANDGLLPEQ